MTNKKYINNILKKVLSEIKPTTQEHKETIAKINLLTSSLKKIVPKDIEITVTGSVSRGTNLKGNSDIDIFLLFKTGTTKEQLEKLGLRYGKSLINKKSDYYEVKYAEHPYVRVFLNSLDIKADIVPALKIQNAENLATSVDRTPLHTIFINEKLTEKQKDEVRLLKYFLKNHSIYGAETKTSGFSGYLCEILVYNFGTFLNVLKWGAEISMPVVIITGKNNDLSTKELINKFNSDFIIIDPIDKERNVAAVLSKESISRFILISRAFLEKPSLDYFYGLKYSDNDLNTYIKNFIKKTDLELYILIFKVPEKSEEIIWPQIKKSSTIIEQYLKKNEFDIYFSLQFISKNNGIILFAAPKQEKQSRVFKGPESTNRKAAKEFMLSHKTAAGFIFSDLRINAIDKVNYKNILDILNAIRENKQLFLHKDIDLSKATILKNKIPNKFSKDISYELIKKFYI
ncbi:MAG: CCA tRNA nucleotidyltransferase [Candidatus Micrarchaeaceae archaeon]